MRAYIQQVDNQFPDDWLYDAYLGFNKLGIDTYFFEDINTVPFKNDNIVVGFIEDTQKHFLKRSIVLHPLNQHPTVEKYYQRFTDVLTMKSFRSLNKFPIFVKPYNKLKQFDSGVITKASSVRFFDHIHENERVFISEIIDIITEYRAFVYNNELVGLECYMGDFKVFPDVSVIENAISDFSKSTVAVPCTQSTRPPVAYTMDFAVSNMDGIKRTVMIEMNDMWCVGNYGLDAKLYAKMLRDRWLEIFKDYK